MKTTAIDTFRFGIGEGATWDAEEQRFYAVDVLAREIVRYDPVSNEVERFDVGQIVGSMALRVGGGALVALATGVHLFDFDSCSTKFLIDLEPDDRSLLLTEGKADPAGRFVVSSFALAMSDPVGSYYAVGTDGQSRVLRDAVTVPNGLAWSPDGATIYYADSNLSTVFAADYDAASGTVSGERVFITTGDLGGIPDGATTDADGNYWVTICQAGLVAGFDPTGKLIHKIEFPSKWVSSVEFGGRDLDRLFVTSLNPEMMNMGEDTEGGKLFIVDGLGVRGLGSRRCAI